MRIAIAMVFLSLVSSAVFAEDKGGLVGCDFLRRRRRDFQFLLCSVRYSE